MSDFAQAVAAFEAAIKAWDAADPEGTCEGPEWSAYEDAENGLLRSPCLSLDDIRVKVRLFLENGPAFDTLENCSIGSERCLVVFLQSLLGEGGQANG